MPVNPAYLKKGTRVYDLVYLRMTELVTAAREKKLTAVPGHGMLVNQAQLSNRFWFPEWENADDDRASSGKIRRIMREAAIKKIQNPGK